MPKKSPPRVLPRVPRSSVNGITRTPGVCGGDACIKGTRMPVWVLEGMRQLGATNEQLLEMYPELSQDELARAWRYVSRNRAEIEHSIHENDR